MAKININKPTGSEVLSLLSAFKTENLTYVIFDSEKVGSMGLPIIYISKLTEKLEKVTDDNEWQSVKNSLKGIINGTNYEYVNVAETMNADEAFYTPLTLPQSSFDLIKSRYVVTGSDGGETKSLTPTPEVQIQEEVKENISEANVSVEPNVNTVIDMPVAPVTVSSNESVNEQPSVPDIAPIMPTANAESNASYVATPNVAPEVVPMPVTSIEQASTQVNEVNNMVEDKIEIPVTKFDSNIFMQDKETFLKACENMFDALVSKYQKQLEDLETREQLLKSKEAEVENKLNDANEHLANAEAREQVANIAHDNAQKVMDLNNLMPSNPTTN